MLKKTKNVKLIRHFPCLVISCFLVFFIFLTNSVNVKAENTHTYTLPYNIDDYADNQTLFEGLSSKILADYASQVGSHPEYALNASTLLIVPFDFNSGKLRLYVCSDVVINDTSSISSVYSSPVRVTFTQPSNNKYSSFIFTYNMSGDQITDLWSISCQSSGWYFNMFGSSSVQTFTGSTLKYQFYYPIDIVNDITDTYDNVVVTKNRGDLDEVAVFNAFENGLDITSTISNGIDSSLSDLQNQQGFFTNLIANLKNFFNALNGWINNGFSTLIGNIKSFFGPFLSNIFNKLSSFFGSFEDFKDKWNNFFEIINSIYNMSLENGEFSLAKLISVLLVPDQSDLNNVFQGTPLYTLYTGIISAGNNFYTTITGVLSSNYVYVFSLPTFTFCGKTFTGLQVSFDWYIPYKSYGDIIISCFLVIGYIRFLMNFIPNFFYGSGFIDHDVNNLQGRYDHL